MLEVKNLIKIYGTQKAVNDISFSAGKGKVLGFLGPNGAGKSTTMKIACSYLKPDAGTVSVCGYDVVEQSIDSRRNIGYLPEHNPLYLDMYVKEFLEYAGKLNGLNGELLGQRVKAMVELTGLEREQKKLIGALSKGYRQRVGLAQAMIHDPAVLILDEPTGGLDPNQIVEIRNVIKEAGKHKTVILSTHIMQEVQAVCDEIIIINKGEIVANESVETAKSGFKIKFLMELDRVVESAELMEIAGLDRAEHIGGMKYLLYAKDKKDIRPQISAWAQNKGYLLLGLSKQEEQLEDIFRNLTK